MSLIKKVKTATLKGTRYKPSKFENTPQWQAIKTAMHRGTIKPGETDLILWEKADEKRYGIAERRTIARFLQRYIAKHELPYRAGILTKDGQDFVTVAHQEEE